MNFIMLLQFVEEREGFATDITVELSVLLLPVNHLHVFVDVGRAEFLVTQLALLRLLRVAAGDVTLQLHLAPQHSSTLGAVRAAHVGDWRQPHSAWQINYVL